LNISANFFLKKLGILFIYSNKFKAKLLVFSSYKYFQQALIIPSLLFGIVLISCSKDNSTPDSSYTCLTCKTTPDALVANNASVKGVYKGIVVGSTATIAIKIQNGSNIITATMVLDGVSVSIPLTSTVTVFDGKSYTAPFAGTLNGSAISITFLVAIGGGTPTITSSNIPGHSTVTFSLFKEISTSLLEAFEGTYSKTGETGTFNLLLSTGLGKFGVIVKKDLNGVSAFIKGTYVNNQVVDNTGHVLGVITGVVMNGSFLDGNGTIVTIIGKRTL
jgi:hypothetical protein